MYELDHMLNGKGSSQHHKELIQQAEHERMAHNIKPYQLKRKVASPLRVIYAAVMHIIGSI